MTITIPSDIARAAERIAKASGKTPEDILVQALQAHFPPIPSDLQADFDAWDQASDEDMAKLNKMQGLTW